MALTPGTRLGHYDVTALIGEGGMGQVWQATDTQLNRQVALKTLPDAFTTDTDRLARFQREARVLASLNHPNIAAIYGIEIGEGDDTKALVLELVEGPTLADRLAQGALSVEDALPIATQIAEALEAAHEAGVIHRDLKPANIKVRPDGTVKVLDFGLAKALEPAPEGDPALSPTMTAAVTQMGVIMGTAAYMAPEQAKGQPVDHRADLWAFGVVLLEMLTGQQAFPGPTVSESLARILERGPDLDALPPDTPATVRRLLKRCLTKDRRQRLQHAGDARVELTEAMDRPDADAVIPAAVPPTGRSRMWQTVVIVAVVAAAAYAAGRWAGDTGTVATEFRRLVLPLDVEQRNFSVGTSRSFAISPAGDTVVFAVAPRLGEPLYRRDLDGIETVPIAGTERGEAPFFSPDGRWVGYYVTREAALYRVSLAGGAPERVTVTAGGPLRGASWGPDDEIVFSTAATPGLMRVPASGGTPEPFTTTAAGQRPHVFPHHLPAEHGLLFTMLEPGGLPQIAAMSADGGDLVQIGIRGLEPRYLAAGSGYLVFGQGAGLLAVPFDAETLAVEGVPVSILAPVQMNRSDTGWVDAAFATDGTAVFQEPQSEGQLEATWVARDGLASPVDGIEPGAYRQSLLSLDGRRLALSYNDNSLRLHDLDTEELFTPDQVGGGNPRWSPEGTRIAFGSNRTGAQQLYTVDVSATDGAVLLVETNGASIPGSWSRDGGTLFFYLVDPETNRDLYAYSFDDGQVTPLLTTPADERAPMVSPDGRWLAYLSDVSGQLEVHVSSLPGFDVARQVSRDGGFEPSWSAAGDELFYRSGAGAMVSVPFRAEPELTLGRPQELFRDDYLREEFGNTSYGVAPDGRFLMLREAEGSEQTVQLQVALGFADEVHRLVSAQQ